MRFTIEIVRDLDFDSHISKGIEENFSPFCFLVKMKLLLQKKFAPAQSIKEIEADELAEKIAEKLEAREKKVTEAEKQTGFNSLF